MTADPQGAVVLTEHERDVVIEAAHPSRPDRAVLLPAVVERIVADRVAQVTAERDQWRIVAETCGRLRNDNLADLAEARRVVAGVRALAEEWSRPMAGARQRANTNEDFAAIAANEGVRSVHTKALRALLPPAAEEER